jgi:hypothetical protein
MKGNWRMMMILSCFPGIIIAFGTYFYMKESPRFLLATSFLV